jgi:hypothetical protein
MIHEAERGTPRDKANYWAHCYRLRAGALEAYPAIADLGDPGDEEFEAAIESAMDIIDGSAAFKLELELDEMDDEDD